MQHIGPRELGVDLETCNTILYYYNNSHTIVFFINHIITCVSAACYPPVCVRV